MKVRHPLKDFDPCRLITELVAVGPLGWPFVVTVIMMERRCNKFGFLIITEANLVDLRPSSVGVSLLLALLRGLLLLDE